MSDRIRAVAAGRSPGMELALAGLVAAVLAPAASSVGVAGWTGLAALCLPLVWQRRAPVLVFWVVFGAT